MTRGPWIRLSLAAVLVAAWALPAPAGAQSLADVARKEQARRQQAGKPSKVYTNQDLAPSREPAAPAPTPGDNAGAVGHHAGVPPATAPAEAGGASTDRQPPATDAPREPERGEKYWRERITAARADLERLQTFADALQARIGALTLDFVNRDDPAQRAVVEQNRQKAVAELERVQRDIAAQTKTISGIEDEARKAGAPAGWLR
jgi:hypothetical protein